MKNYRGAVTVLNMLNDNGFFTETEEARLVNLAVRMIKPPRNRQILKMLQWASAQLVELEQVNPNTRHKIPMIKLVRNEFGWSLKQSKDWVETNFSDCELNSGVPLDFP